MFDHGDNMTLFKAKGNDASNHAFDYCDQFDCDGDECDGDDDKRVYDSYDFDLEDFWVVPSKAMPCVDADGNQSHSLIAQGLDD